MDHKTAAEILVKVLQKYLLTDEEKEAVKTAIGILAWTKLTEGKRKAQREKRARNATTPDWN